MIVFKAFVQSQSPVRRLHTPFLNFRKTERKRRVSVYTYESVTSTNVCHACTSAKHEALFYKQVEYYIFYSSWTFNLQLRRSVFCNTVA